MLDYKIKRIIELLNGDVEIVVAFFEGSIKEVVRKQYNPETEELDDKTVKEYQRDAFVGEKTFIVGGLPANNRDRAIRKYLNHKMNAYARERTDVEEIVSGQRDVFEVPKLKEHHEKDVWEI